VEKEVPKQHLPAKNSEPKKVASAKSTSSALEALSSIGTSFGKIQGCGDFLASDVEGFVDCAMEHCARDVKAKHGAAFEAVSASNHSISLDIERSTYGRFSLDASRKETKRLHGGRMSAEMKRASMESQTSKASTYSVVSTVPKGEVRGTCSRSHPMFSQNFTSKVQCSLCGCKTNGPVFSCTGCNYHKCDCCALGIKRPKQEKPKKPKKPSCFAPVFSFFRRNPTVPAPANAPEETAAPNEGMETDPI